MVIDVVWPGTDTYVLDALMRHRRLTRAELAVEIGISKPTAGESVRRLTERGLVEDTGERTPGGRGRGRVGSYYALSPTVGTALAITIAPSGVVAERLDVYGDTLARTVKKAPWKQALEAAAAEVSDGARVAVVSAADPVDRATGRLVQLPDAPFLVGELDPVAVLAPHVAGPVIVDNDVNWAATAERNAATMERTDEKDFAYLHLGEGLGCAIVNDGAIRRGHTGLTGEIAHLLTVGPGGRAIRFIELFGELGLRRPGETAIDVEQLMAATPARETIAEAVAGVAAAIIALADPREVVVGGSWGPALLTEISAAAARLPRSVPLRATTLTGEPAMTGVRAAAVGHLRALITGRTPPAAATTPH